MPPKVKFSKEEIISSAVNVVREKGADSLTAREIAAKLGVSTRPIFTYFATMDELRAEVYSYAKNLYKEYILEGLSQKIPNLGVGRQYIKFARNESELYKLLYFSKPSSYSHGAIDALKFSQELVRDSIMKNYNMSDQTADKFFRDLWLVAHSITTLIVMEECPYSDEEIENLLTEFSLSICKAYKEIPGLPEGNYNRDEIFRELVKL